MKTTVELDPSERVVKHGKHKVWTGAVPATPIEEAVQQARHYAWIPKEFKQGMADTPLVAWYIWIPR